MEVLVPGVMLETLEMTNGDLVELIILIIHNIFTYTVSFFYVLLNLAHLTLTKINYYFFFFIGLWQFVSGKISNSFQQIMPQKPVFLKYFDNISVERSNI